MSVPSVTTKVSTKSSVPKRKHSDLSSAVPDGLVVPATTDVETEVASTDVQDDWLKFSKLRITSRVFSSLIQFTRDSFQPRGPTSSEMLESNIFNVMLSGINLVQGIPASGKIVFILRNTGPTDKDIGKCGRPVMVDDLKGVHHAVYLVTSSKDSGDISLSRIVEYNSSHGVYIFPVTVELNVSIDIHFLTVLDGDLDVHYRLMLGKNNAVP